MDKCNVKSEIIELAKLLDTMVGNSSELKARKIYNAGYRKQSEGEWMNDGWGSFKCPVCDGSALKNGYEQPVKSKFCPHCGAKMKT